MRTTLRSRILTKIKRVMNNHDGSLTVFGRLPVPTVPSSARQSWESEQMLNAFAIGPRVP